MQPEVVSRKLKPEKQAAFIATYEQTLNRLEADEMVVLAVACRPKRWRAMVHCQRVGASGYLVEGVSVLPERDGAAAYRLPVWTYLNYRAVAWTEAADGPRYRVEWRDPVAEVWCPAEDWESGLWPDTVGGVVDCLLWLKQKAML